MKVYELEKVVVGRVSKTFGLGGELVISLYDTFEYNNEEPVFVDIDAKRTPLFFKQFNRRGKSKAVVIFDDLESEYRASELIGKELYSLFEPEEADDDDDDELYMENLIGYSVIFSNEKMTGKIVDFIESDLNPLFSIEIEGRDILIPAADDFIVTINQKKRSITLNIPHGLLEINE